MNVSKTALVASCDPDIIRIIEFCLTQEGFCVLVTQQGERVYEMQQAAQPDLVVLDADLPEPDGWQLCQLIRKNSPVPIVMLAGVKSLENLITGLEMGADECLIKPINCREALARINAIFRRIGFTHPPQPETRIRIGDLSLDKITYKVYKGGQELLLRQKEYDLLNTLMSSPGKVLSRAELLDQVWGIDWLGDTRTLDVHIRWVRIKIEEEPSEPRYIQTVRGVGYRFVSPAELSLQ
ncbi:MAG: Transcriptional regulatory protein WalR [Anaerolineae bacterium]|nr:Transcriptional regulatory protein WalR [Anaerolineae bacterium]